MTRAILPMINSMNVFMLYTTNAREVTRSVEGGNDGGVDGNFFIEGGEVRDIVQTGLRVLLTMYKFLDQLHEVGLVNLIWINMFHYLWSV